MNFKLFFFFNFNVLNYFNYPINKLYVYINIFILEYDRKFNLSHSCSRGFFIALPELFVHSFKSHGLLSLGTSLT